MKLDEILKQTMVPLVVSAVLGLASVVYNAGTQKTLLENNIIVTQQLSQAVTELRLQMAVYGEKFITRDELEKRLQSRTLAERN